MPAPQAAALTESERKLIDRLFSNPLLLPTIFKQWLINYLGPEVQITQAQVSGGTPPAHVGESGQPAFEHAWVNYDASRYEAAGFDKDPSGRVNLAGLVRDGTIGQTIFTLPAGYRPQSRQVFTATCDTGLARVDVLSDGEVLAVSGTNGFLSLSGISFRSYS